MRLKDKYLVIILFFLALILRLIGLGEHSLFADEITWMVKGKEYFFALKQINLNYFNYGPWLDKSTTWPIALPMSLLSGIMLVVFSPGQSSKSIGIINEIIAGRIPAVIIGSLFIPVFYLLIKKHLGGKIAIIASFLLIFDPVFLGLSRWVSQDLMLMVASFLSITIFLNNKSFKTLIISAFLASLAVLTKPQGIVVAVALFLYAITMDKTKRIKELVWFLKWFLLFIILTIILFPFLWNNPFKMLWYLKIQAEAVAQTPPIIFLGQITTNPPWYYYLLTTPFHLAESVLIGFVAGLTFIFIKIKKHKKQLSPLVKIAFIYAVLFLLTISWSAQKLGVRYAFPLWPYLFLVAGYGLLNLAGSFKQGWQKIYWLVVFLPLLAGVVKFYPSFYLYHNVFISTGNYQKLESVGFCDGIKPAMEYLSPKLHEGIKIMFYDCSFSANYYTGYTLNHVYSVSDKPEYIIMETYSSQKDPSVERSLWANNYKLIKNINFRGLNLARIYSK